MTDILPNEQCMDILLSQLAPFDVDYAVTTFQQCSSKYQANTFCKFIPETQESQLLLVLMIRECLLRERQTRVTKDDTKNIQTIHQWFDEAVPGLPASIQACLDDIGVPHIAATFATVSQTKSIDIPLSKKAAPIAKPGFRGCVQQFFLQFLKNAGVEFLCSLFCVLRSPPFHTLLRIQRQIYNSIDANLIRSDVFVALWDTAKPRKLPLTYFRELNKILSLHVVVHSEYHLFSNPAKFPSSPYLDFFLMQPNIEIIQEVIESVTWILSNMEDIHVQQILLAMKGNPHSFVNAIVQGLFGMSRVMMKYAFKTMYRVLQTMCMEDQSSLIMKILWSLGNSAPLAKPALELLDEAFQEDLMHLEVFVQQSPENLHETKGHLWGLNRAGGLHGVMKCWGQWDLSHVAPHLYAGFKKCLEDLHGYGIHGLPDKVDALIQMSVRWNISETVLQRVFEMLVTDTATQDTDLHDWLEEVKHQCNVIHYNETSLNEPFKPLGALHWRTVLWGCLRRFNCMSNERLQALETEPAALFNLLPSILQHWRIWGEGLWEERLETLLLRVLERIDETTAQRTKCLLDAFQSKKEGGHHHASKRQRIEDTTKSPSTRELVRDLEKAVKSFDKKVDSITESLGLVPKKVDSMLNAFSVDELKRKES